MNLESGLEHIIDEDRVKASRAAGDKWAEGFTTEDYKAMRIRSKKDLYFLCKGVLGFRDLSVGLHRDMCRWHRRNRKARFKLELLPRSHFKSTIITIGGGIQVALPDDAGDEDWPECLGLNIRVMLGHDVKEQASHFLLQITDQYLGNPVLQALFPEAVPDVKRQRVNLNELELPRSQFWAEATYTAMGVGARSQGKHFNYFKLDDLIGEKDRDSKTEMKRSMQWFDNLQAFFVDFTRDKMDLVGTRYSFDDLYNHAMEQYGEQIIRYIRRAEEPDENNVLQPIFPERFTTESFEILKRNPVVWNSQYLNAPEESGEGFDEEWLQFYHKEFEKIEFVQNGITHIRYLKDLDIVVLVDPAMSGKGAIVVTGMDALGNIFVLEAIKENWRLDSTPQVIEKFFELNAKYSPRLFAIEDVLFSGLFKHWLDAEFRNRGVSFRVEPIKTKGRAKEARVFGLASYFSAGKMFFHLSQQNIITEFNQFPLTMDYHLLDSLAQGPEVWIQPFTQAEQDLLDQSQRKYLSYRDATTGY